MKSCLNSLDVMAVLRGTRICMKVTVLERLLNNKTKGFLKD